jgi:hypothetical protein
MAYTTFGLTFNTINEMKAFAAEHGIKVAGHKSFSQTWLDAIESYMEVQSEVIATAKDAKIAAESASVEVEKVVVAIVEVLTSDKAIEIYRTLLRFAMVAIVFVLFTIGKIGKWLWENRDRTAVYHWIQDAGASKVYWRIKTELVITKWIADRWLDDRIVQRDRLVQVLFDRMELVLARIGLGGCAIEIQ